MQPKLNFIVAAVLGLAPAVSAQSTEFIALFDGSTLDGWEGDHDIWRVVDGAIVGGTLDSPSPERNYLCTARRFADFELRVTARIEGSPNGGVNFRSRRISGSNEVGGYQADIGFIPGQFINMLSDLTDVDAEREYPLWGSLLDLFRDEPGRYPDPSAPYWLVAVADRAQVEQVLRRGDWNELWITALGSRIEIRLNGTRTIQFVEANDLDQGGVICLQIHDGPPTMAWYKDIQIKDLTPR
jgi:hypothetical protein